MRKLILILTVIINLFCVSCKKKSEYKIEFLELYNKPLNETRSKLNGKWQEHKIQGGVGGFITYPRNTFVEFKFGDNISNDSIKVYNDTTILANNKAIWSREYTNIWISDSTYILKYFDNFLFYNSRVIIKIKNDTLEIGDNYPDGFLSFYTKVE
ncbi:MAG TPA: hypothetical protein PKI86_00860 [Chitinophagales bacterium]|jgi:hypothetical protein|nr:hypothetical protein [Chitinophagales bacterium]